MPRIFKRLQSPISHVSMLPRADLPQSVHVEVHRLGALSGIYSILALDFSPTNAVKIGVEPKGLRDDWVAIGDDLRVVMRRNNRRIEQDKLAQSSLLANARD